MTTTLERPEIQVLTEITELTECEVRTELPDTLSGLIRLALADFRDADRNSFVPNSGIWLMKNANQRCYGCLAGIVMLSMIVEDDITDFKSYDNPDSWTFDNDIRNKLMALDSFRSGDSDEAFEHLGIRPILSGEDKAFLWSPPNYGEFLNWEELDRFIGWAEKAATILESYGA